MSYLWLYQVHGELRSDLHTQGPEGAQANVHTEVPEEVRLNQSAQVNNEIQPITSQNVKV